MRSSSADRTEKDLQTQNCIKARKNNFTSSRFTARRNGQQIRTSANSVKGDERDKAHIKPLQSPFRRCYVLCRIQGR
ncbi:hypothetical protein MKW98_019957 [Papaver atlanticum]|uniref:Uncharacterized protein n=1 Tax=Papaver atlanticum TaxID=357466 RepID=A0AAD4X792_9MAGN|nr:hypothetical protein MKW98_019957 [Papaver atlanticum]